MNYRILNPKQFLPALSLVIITALSSCGPMASPDTPNPEATKPLKAVFINPHKAGTHEHFKASPSYPKTYNVYKNTSLLSKTNSSNSKIVIKKGLQRALLMNGAQVAMDYPVSTGKSSYPTPSGSFRITEKIVDKRSNLYGKIVNASGSTVKSGADSRKDKVPEGGKFIGAAMPNWMRLTGDGVGMHQGRVPRYAASHGCIRTPSSVVRIVYGKVRVGTSVTITQ
ncbi:MAG: L,D-transpeptidase [Akkermansiaceae bacterium]